MSCPLLFSERVPDLVWFGFVYLVATAGFVADQFMSDEQKLRSLWIPPKRFDIFSPCLGDAQKV